MTAAASRSIRRWGLIASLAAVALVASACGAAPGGGSGERVTVVATISIFADFARAVGGDRVEVHTLVPVGGDPHTFEPRPSDARLLATADLIVTNGLGLAPTLDPLVDAAAAEVPVVVLSAGLEPIVEDEGDYAGRPDPHLWMDPTLAARYVERIEAGLAEVDPAGAGDYRAGGESYRARLADLDRWIAAQIDTIPAESRRFFTNHDSFRYFTTRYGLERGGAIFELTTEAEPSASQIRELVAAIREHRPPAVFVETTVDARLMERVARDGGTRLGAPLYGDSVGEQGSGAETYEDMMRANTVAIVEGLGGTVSLP